MTPLVLVCSLCLPAAQAQAQLGLPSASQRLMLERPQAAGEAPPPPTWERPQAAGEAPPPPTWETPALVGSMAAVAVGGNALAATRGFDVGRLAIDESAMVVGSLAGIAGVLWASFALGPEGGGLLLPLTERKLIGVLLLGGVVGGIGALTAAEAIGGHLDHPWALLGGAGGFLVTSAVIVALVDGIFGLPVWANALLLPLGLAGGTAGGYALAVPRG